MVKSYDGIMPPIMKIHGAKNRWHCTECWRPCCVRGSKQKVTVRERNTAKPLYPSLKEELAVCFLIHTEKAMAPHSSTLAWKIPWTEEPERLQSMGSLKVGHDWATSLSLFTFMHWRRKWQPTPLFLPGESQGRGEPGGLPSMGSHRVGHDWSDLAVAAAVSSSWIRSWEIRAGIIHSNAYKAHADDVWRGPIIR